MALNEQKTAANSAGKNPWLILATVFVGTFMSTLDSSIANVALPTISDQLNITIHSVQWVITSYLLTICAMLPIMGKLSDKWGKGRVYNFGFIIFTVGSALCGLSGTLPSLIGARVVQALGASCLMSCSQGIVAETFAVNGRGKALGIIGVAVSLGSLTGPGVGGLLLDRMDWTSIFWVNVPIGILATFAGFFFLPKDRLEKKKAPFDYMGSILFIAGMVALLYSISNGEDFGWTSPVIIIGLVASIAVLVLFYTLEHKTAHPMLDFQLYEIRAFRLGTIASFLSFVAQFVMNIMMPFYLQNVLHFRPDITGYAMMLLPLTMAVAAPFSGWLSDKIGYRILTTGGLAINALAFGLLNTLDQHAGFGIIALHLCLFGIGGGMFQSPNNSSVMGAVPKPKLGSAGSINALVRNLGMVIGASLSVTLYSAVLKRSGEATPAAMLGALHVVFWTAMGVCILALIVSALRLTSAGEKTITEAGK